MRNTSPISSFSYGVKLTLFRVCTFTFTWRKEMPSQQHVQPSWRRCICELSGHGTPVNVMHAGGFWTCSFGVNFPCYGLIIFSSMKRSVLLDYSSTQQPLFTHLAIVNSTVMTSGKQVLFVVFWGFLLDWSFGIMKIFCFEMTELLNFSLWLISHTERFWFLC